MWFILSLVAGLTFATNRLIMRSVFTQHSNPLAFGAIHELLAGLFLLPIGLFYFSLPQSPQIWLALGAGIFLIFLTDLFAFLALKNIEASLLQIINQLRHVVILLGAFFIFAVFELVLFIALAIGEASKVSPISQSSLIFTIIGGYIFLNERSHMKQKIIGSVLIAVGIFSLYFI